MIPSKQMLVPATNSITSRAAWTPHRMTNRCSRPNQSRDYQINGTPNELEGRGNTGHYDRGKNAACGVDHFFGPKWEE
jgi:hypothetical protein